MKRLPALLLIVSAGAWVYISSLNYGFSQDDFIHLYSSRTDSISGFLNFFNPFYRYPDIFFFRPLTTQVYFFINRLLFGLNPLPFHIEGLLLHLINSVLFFYLINKIWKNTEIAFFSALFYAVSAAHFLSIYYISAFQETGRMFFILALFLTFLNYQISKRKVFYILSLLSFTAALFSKETSLIAPLLLFPLVVIRNEEQKVITTLKSLLKPLIPFLIVILIYGGVRLSGFQSVFNEGYYNTAFSFPEVLQNLKWYVVWSLGLPEILSSYPSLKPASLIQFGRDLPFGNPVLLLSVLTGIIILSLVSGLKVLTKKVLIASLAVFFTALGPVLILQGHRYPQYLDLAFIGFLPILSVIFLQQGKVKRILGITGIIFFIILQVFSIKLSEQTHWTTHRAIVADYYFEGLKKSYPDLPPNSEINFTGTKESAYQLSLALAQKYALLVWYPNRIKNVSYEAGPLIDSQGSTMIFSITIY